MNIATAIIVAMVMASTITLAQPPQGPEGKHGEKGRRMEKMAKELGLTADQQEQLRHLRSESMTEMRALSEAFHDARKATQDLIASESSTEEDVMKSVVAEGAAYLALSKARAEHQLKVRSIVGAEKAGQMIEMRDDWRMKRGNGKGPHDPQ